MNHYRSLLLITLVSAVLPAVLQRNVSRDSLIGLVLNSRPSDPQERINRINRESLFIGNSIHNVSADNSQALVDLRDLCTEWEDLKELAPGIFAPPDISGSFSGGGVTQLRDFGPMLHL